MVGSKLELLNEVPLVVATTIPFPNVVPLVYVTPLDGTVLSGTLGVRTIKYLLAAGDDAVNEPETLEMVDVKSKLLGPLGAVQLGGAVKVYVCPMEGLFPPLYKILAALDVPLVVDDHKDEEEERQL